MPPPKSACFFCPASKSGELIALAKTHPELWMRAIEMEDKSLPSLDTIGGLWTRPSRNFSVPASWREFGEQQGLPLPPRPPGYWRRSRQDWLELFAWEREEARRRREAKRLGVEFVPSKFKSSRPAAPRLGPPTENPECYGGAL